MFNSKREIFGNNFGDSKIKTQASANIFPS